MNWWRQAVIVVTMDYNTKPICRSLGNVANSTGVVTVALYPPTWQIDFSVLVLYIPSAVNFDISTVLYSREVYKIISKLLWPFFSSDLDKSKAQHLNILFLPGYNTYALISALCWIASRNGRLASCNEGCVDKRIFWTWSTRSAWFFIESSSLVCVSQRNFL